MIDNPIRMSRRALLALPEYSASIPTGTTTGKRWRRAIPWGAEHPEWWQGRYGKPYPEGHEHHGQIPIFWRRIIVQGVAPRFPSDLRVPTRRMR